MVFQWLVLILWGFSAAYAQDTCPTFSSVRLVQTASITQTNAGRVEVCRNGVWGTVCADSLTTPWSENNAQVVCNQLGYSGALNSIPQDSVPSSERADNSTPIHYHSVRCSGEEESLTDCSGIYTATASCRHSQDAYIECRPLSGTQETPSGLSLGAIFGIVFAVFVVLVIIVPFVYGVGRDTWSRRRTSSWYQTMTHWFSHSQNTPTPPVAMETSGTGFIITRTRGSSRTSSNDEPEQPPQRPDAELVVAPPPSYRASSNYPTGDPLNTPPTDLPPPYPGSLTARAGNPPAGLGFSPNYQGPPPPAYPGGALPYSTTVPYPIDTSSHPIEIPHSPSTPDVGGDNCSGGGGGSGGSAGGD